MSNSILFLRPTSRTYQRDLKFAKKVYQGVVPKKAAVQLGMTEGAAWVVLHRLRQRATQWANQEVSDAMILRLMFDRERAEAEWKETCNQPYNGSANVGEKRAT